MKNTTKKIIAILISAIVLVSAFGVCLAIDNNKTNYTTSTINPTPKVSYQYRICKFYEFDTETDTITFEDEDMQLWAVYNDFTVNENANYLMMFNENEEIISIMEIIK